MGTGIDELDELLNGGKAAAADLALGLLDSLLRGDDVPEQGHVSPDFTVVVRDSTRT